MGFEPMRQCYPPTRFPIVLLRPARTTLQLTNSASRARTYDIMINSHALCQLSYCGIKTTSPSMATTYSHRTKGPTTIGAKKLNYCVRNGNRCVLLAIITTLGCCLS